MTASVAETHILRGDSNSALRPRREQGQATALAAVVMVAMVGMLAFVVDAGMFLMAHRELQKAADAGAVAAMLDLQPDPADPTNQVAALATAINVTQRNFGIANSLCTVSAPEFLSPKLGTPQVGMGTYTLEDGSGFIYTVTVTVRCRAGYTFGKILDLLDMPISATGTSGFGALKSTDCPIPFVVPPGSSGPLDAEHAYGWTPGQPMVLQIGGITTQEIDGVQILPTTTICLSGSNCGATDLKNWITRNPCVPVSAGDDTVNNNGGNNNVVIGPVLDGFATRMQQTAYANGDKVVTCPFGQSPQTATPPVADGDWRLIANSPCLVAMPVMTQQSFIDLSTTNGSVQSLDVLGFNLFYLSYVAQQTGGQDTEPPCYQKNGVCLAGYFLKPALNGTLGAFNTSGQPLWRPIR